MNDCSVSPGPVPCPSHKRAGQLFVLSAALLLCLLPSSASLAQPDPEPSVKPDRPSFTNGIQIVPLGHLQFESGATAEFTGSDRNLWIGELTIRVPVSKSIEFRGLVGTYGHSTSGGETRQGFMNVLLDAKVRLIDTETSDFGFIAGAIVPVGSNDFRQQHLQPYLTLCFEHPLSETIGLTANSGIVYRSVSGEQLAQVYGGAGLTFDVASRVSLYGEI